MKRRVGALLAAVVVSVLPLHGARSAVPTQWLELVNYYRGLAGLSAVTEDASYSDGDAKHARYMVENNVIGHSEDPSNPWYTPEGNVAAQNSNVFLGYSSANCLSDKNAIDGWMTGPFHALGILRTTLVKTGFGSFAKQFGSLCRRGAALDVLRGTGADTHPPYPYSWPANGAGVPLLKVTENEFPNPLTSCSGYANPAGLPVYAFFAANSNAISSTFSSDGQQLAHCIYNGNTYTNPDAGSQSLGRSILSSAKAVVLIPRAPLTDETDYTASITSGGVTHSWTFHTSLTGNGGGGGTGAINGTLTKVTSTGTKLANGKVCVDGACQAASGAYTVQVAEGTHELKAKVRKRICSSGGDPSPITVTVADGETKTFDWLCVRKR